MTHSEIAFPSFTCEKLHKLHESRVHVIIHIICPKIPVNTRDDREKSGRLMFKILCCSSKPHARN